MTSSNLEAEQKTFTERAGVTAGCSGHWVVSQAKTSLKTESPGGGGKKVQREREGDKDEFPDEGSGPVNH